MAADRILIITTDSTAKAIPGAPYSDAQLSRFIVARDNPPNRLPGSVNAISNDKRLAAHDLRAPYCLRANRGNLHCL
jgi:hypothetical protein